MAGIRAGAVPRQGTRAGGLRAPLVPGPTVGHFHALAGSRCGESLPPDPRYASASRGGWEHAAPRARRQHQLAVVPVRHASSPVAAILSRSGGAASRGGEQRAEVAEQVKRWGRASTREASLQLR